MIRFDEETHTYWNEDKELRSVTQYLKEIGLERFDYPEWYAERGHAVHTAIELLNKDTLDWSTVDPQIKGFIDAYLKAKENLKFETLRSEFIVSAPELNLAGTVDELSMFPDIGQAIVDFKTGAKKRLWALQTAGYSLAYLKEHGELLPRIVLKLSGDGSYERIDYADTHDLIVYTGIINLVEWRNKCRKVKPLVLPEEE